MRNATYLCGAIFGAIWLALRSDYFSAEAGTAALGALLLMLCMWPAVAWLASGMVHLPLFEVYCLCHLIFYWLPAGKAGSDFFALIPSDQMIALAAVCLYLICGQLAYFGLLRRLQVRRDDDASFWSNRVPMLGKGALPWVLLLFSLSFSVARTTGIIWEFVPWSVFPYVRALATVSGLLGLFVLGRLSGEGRLSRLQNVLFVLGVTVSILVSFASGYLGMGSVFVGNAFFAYSVGARKLPVITMSAFVLLLSFLNYGKSEMRRRYWHEGEAVGSLTELYSFWFQASWEELNAPKDARGGAAISAIDRANLIQVYTQIIRQTPRSLPFLNGQTYLDNLALFVPRALWPDRPDLNFVMNQLGLRYGIHTSVDSTESTNISIGQIGEAWANGGWLAVAAAGTFFGCFFHLGVRTAYGRDTNTVGFLFGMTMVGFTVALEHLLGAILMMYYQTAIVGLVILYILSSRTKPSPQPVRGLGDARKIGQGAAQ